jgi:HK97 family phage prohead protease
MSLVTRGLSVKSLNDTGRTASFIASTDAIDSYDEIVEQDWILDRYRTNPVVLFAHDSRELPVGQCIDVGVVNGQLECTVKFCSAEANPHAERVWQSVREGALRAVSVGFRPGDVRFEKRNGKEVFVLSKNELHEISVVPIPANPEALAKMKTRARASVDAQEREKETAMDIEKMLAQREAELRAAEGKVAAKEKELAAVLLENESLGGKLKTLTTERDALLERAKVAEDKIVESEVDALVGVKIAPAEKAEFVELAKSSRSLFERMVKNRLELKLLKPVINDEAKGAPPSTVGSGNGEGLAARISADLQKVG